LSQLLSNLKTVVKPYGVERDRLLEFRDLSLTPTHARARLDHDLSLEDAAMIETLDDARL